MLVAVVGAWTQCTYKVKALSCTHGLARRSDHDDGDRHVYGADDRLRRSPRPASRSRSSGDVAPCSSNNGRRRGCGRDARTFVRLRGFCLDRRRLVWRHRGRHRGDGDQRGER
jgi:hypothetical protein